MSRKITVLDVREMLRAKEEPFQQIMAAVGELGEDDVLELHATFKPDPLIRVLGKQGFSSAVVEEDSEHFVVQFYKGETADIPFFHLDNRELDPPNPMVRTLAFLEEHQACESGELGVEIWNVRVPAILLPELEERNFLFDVNDEGNGTVRIQIRKKV